MVSEENAQLNIDALLKAFLTEQESRLSERRFRQYENVVMLLRCCLDNYGYQHLEEEQRRRFDQAYDHDEEAFCRLFGAAQMVKVFSEFLNYFMVRKVIAGADLQRTAGTVIRLLSRWLRERGHLDAEKARDGEQQGREAARALAQARRLAHVLSRFAELQEPADGVAEEGHFTITEIKTERFRLENDEGKDLGFVAVPPEAVSLARPYWSISGVLVRRGRRLQWAEVWGVYP